MNCITIFFYTFIISFAFPTLLWANVLGACANCHVMHASQSGSDLSQERDSLLNSDCIGCHTGTNTGTFDGSITNMPFVHTTGTTLAGGNFKEAETNERFGHNPQGVTADALYTAPPGWNSGFTDNGQVGTSWGGANVLTCAGVYGCHGTHDTIGVRGSHHNNSTGARSAPGTVGTSFRFLYRVEGYEDSDYEYDTGADDHNVYSGESRSDGTTEAESSADDDGDGTTISNFCAECHGNFHSGVNSSNGISDNTDNFFADPWIRHPVDISMPLTSEYTYSYNYTTPVASTDISNSSVNVNSSGDRIVMCLSCHRAHASPNYASMRFNYRGAGSTWVNGCANCHTEKG